MKKIFTLSVATMLATIVSAQTINILSGGYQVIAISDNGKYMSGNTNSYSPFIWDWQNNKVVEDGENLPEGAAEGVSNNGIAAASSGDEAATLSVDGTITKLAAITDGSMSLSRAVNADGSIFAGCQFNEAYDSHACLWKNGELIMLPEPTDEEFGFEVNGTQAIDISADGKIVMGFVVDNMGTYPLILWRLGDDGKYSLEVTCKNYFTDGNDEYDPSHPYTMFYPNGISANGKWVSLWIEQWGGDWDFSEYRIGRLNLETMELEVAVVDGQNGIEEGQGLEPSRITNDGTMIGYTSARGLFGREGVIWKSGEAQPRLLRDVYNIEEITAYDMMSNTPADITPDGKYIAGFGMNGEGDFESYIIDTTAEPSAINGPETVTGKSVSTMYDITGKAVAAGSAQGKGVYVVKTVQDGKTSTRKVVLK